MRLWRYSLTAFSGSGLVSGRRHFALVNAVIHLTNSLLLFLFGEQIRKNNGISSAAAIIFALHPNAVDVIACPSGRPTLLATTYVLFILWYYMVYSNEKRHLRMNRATICVMMAVVFFFVGPLFGVYGLVAPLGIIWVEFVTPDPILLGKSGTWTELFAKYVIAATLCLHIYKFWQLSEFTLASSHYDVVTYLRIGYTQWTFWPDVQYIALRFLNYFHRMLANIFHFVCPITIVSEWASNGVYRPCFTTEGNPRKP